MIFIEDYFILRFGHLSIVSHLRSQIVCLRYSYRACHIESFGNLVVSTKFRSMLKFLFFVNWRLSSLQATLLCKLIRMIFDLVTDLLYAFLDLFLPLLCEMRGRRRHI